MKESKWIKFRTLLVTYFFQGLLLFAPVAITAYGLYWLFIKIDGIFQFNIPGLGVPIPGLGILILLIIIVFTGFLGSLFVFQPLWRRFDVFLQKFPLTKFIYPSLKDIFGAVVGKERKLNKPVMFKISKELDIERLGFVTERDLSNIGILGNKVAVYAPHSYNFSGNVYIVPSENITPLDADASEVMKFIVSGGMIKVKDDDDE